MFSIPTTGIFELKYQLLVLHQRCVAQKCSARGYFQTAKLIILRELWLQKKGLPSMEEETIKENSILQFKN
jgi:hypothetical protein